jgi:hypothetical protein
MRLVAIELIETLMIARAAGVLDRRRILVLEGRWILTLMIWVVALGKRSRTAEQSQRDRRAYEISHVDLLKCVRSRRTTAMAACIAAMESRLRHALTRTAWEWTESGLLSTVDSTLADDGAVA